MPNDNIDRTMASAYIVGPLVMSSATSRCEVLDVNPTVRVLRRFLNTGKRPSPVVVGAMPMGAFHYRTSPCSYSLVMPLGGFSLQVSLCFESTSIQSNALLDFGASTSFINISIIRAHNIPTIRTTQPISVEAINGWVLSSWAVTEATIPMVLQIGPH